MSRGVVPPNRAVGLVVLAVVAPIVANKLRPVAKMAGKGLVKAGEFVQRLADEATSKKAPAPGTPEERAASNAGVSEETTKVGHTAADVPMEASSPIGHEEMEAHGAAEAAGDGATPEPNVPSRKPRKKLEPDQKLNPRRTKNSRST